MRRALRTLQPLEAGEALEATLLTAPRPTAAIAVLLFVRWAEESCGRRLPAVQRAELESVQAHVLAWAVLRDRIADAGERGHAREVARLWSSIAGLTSSLVPSWGWRRLLRQQSAADACEKQGLPPRLTATFVRQLGRKAALARWPAFAVPRLLGQPRMARAVDRDFDDLLAALQLFDDAVDAEEDASSGQRNALLAGCPANPSAFTLHEHIARRTPPVFAEARKRLRRLSRPATGLGRFARGLLRDSFDAERRAVEVAQARSIAGLLDDLLDRADVANQLFTAGRRVSRGSRAHGRAAAPRRCRTCSRPCSP